MPTVGKKHFAYTKKGVKKAKEYAKKTGQTMEMQKRALKDRMKGSKFHKAYAQEATKTPVYKSGMMNGKPMDYNKMKKGIITSLD